MICDSAQLQRDGVGNRPPQVKAHARRQGENDQHLDRRHVKEVHIADTQQQQRHGAHHRLRDRHQRRAHHDRQQAGDFANRLQQAQLTGPDTQLLHHEVGGHRDKHREGKAKADGGRRQPGERGQFAAAEHVQIAHVRSRPPPVAPTPNPSRGVFSLSLWRPLPNAPRPRRCGRSCSLSCGRGLEPAPDWIRG